MVSYKLDKYDKYFVAFILVILVIFNISQCFASEEEAVELSQVTGIAMSQNSNVFTSADYSSVGYFQAEKGYIYTISIPSNFAESRILGYSSDIPSLNGNYTILTTIAPGSTYTYSFNQDSVIYLDLWQFNPNIQVTRHKIASQETAVDDLVSNVGVNQLWSVFESGIDFIGVIVLVAFGFFLIVLLMKKLSKGKSDF